MASYSSALLVLLLLSILLHIHIDGQNPRDMMEAFPDVRYQSYLNSSLLNQSFIQTKLQCAELCLQNSLCRTATFMQPNRSCSLYTEFTELGTLVKADKTFTFRRQVPYTCSNMTQLKSTDYVGNDFLAVLVSNSTECFRACMLTSNCKGAAYNRITSNNCWFKYSINYARYANTSDVDVLLC